MITIPFNVSPPKSAFSFRPGVFRSGWAWMVSGLMSGMVSFGLLSAQPQESAMFMLSEKEYFTKHGIDVLVFSNSYDGLFSDEKNSGVQLIHHEVRTATNGDVRLSPTPEQWDPSPSVVARRVMPESGRIETDLVYASEGFGYTVRVDSQGEMVRIAVVLDSPLPDELEGKAGLNLEFLPSAYFGRSWMMDGVGGHFDLYPIGPTRLSADAEGSVERLPLVVGRKMVLAPEDSLRRVTVSSADQDLMLFDGRNQAQNGWFVLRSMLPAGKTGEVLVWHLEAHTQPDWVRPTVIGCSQVGYHPEQRKVAVLERDMRAGEISPLRVSRLSEDGEWTEVYVVSPMRWGQWLRYDYWLADFSAVTDPGLYRIEADGDKTHTFRIDSNVFERIWHPTLDVFFPVQMDHMRVREAYRVWHGASHLDDARQAPVDHEHFDLYRQGPTTDTRFSPGEHIPGLNIGGWYDAGDYDIRTQSQYSTVQNLVMLWEHFRPMRDETMVDQERRKVKIHHPDGVPDILQQIEHGTLALIAQHRAVGHAIPGIVEPDLRQYTHLGDGSTKTDNFIFDPTLGPDEVVGNRSGRPDDRWAFTTNTSALNYGSAAALAGASRALKGYRDALAQECLETALRVWDFEHSREPNVFRHGNTTGGHLESEKLKAAVELLLTTRDVRFAEAVESLWGYCDENFPFVASILTLALPHMPENWGDRLRERTRIHVEASKEFSSENPYGVLITRGGWAGNGAVLSQGVTNYLLHRAFPDLVSPEGTLRALDYLLGCHPGSNHSLVSAVGVKSRDKAYGMNRADYSFIAGGIVPGVMIIAPDFPENKEDWPFLWGQQEYVITLGAPYIYLAHAAADLMGVAQRAE